MNGLRVAPATHQMRLPVPGGYSVLRHKMRRPTCERRSQLAKISEALAVPEIAPTFSKMRLPDFAATSKVLYSHRLQVANLTSQECVSLRIHAVPNEPTTPVPSTNQPSPSAPPKTPSHK